MQLLQHLEQQKLRESCPSFVGVAQPRTSFSSSSSSCCRALCGLHQKHSREKGEYVRCRQRRHGCEGWVEGMGVYKDRMRRQLRKSVHVMEVLGRQQCGSWGDGWREGFVCCVVGRARGSR